MATTQVIRPNGVGTLTGHWVGEVASDIADDNGSTAWNASITDSTAVIQFGTYALAADERCKEARFRWNGWLRTTAVLTAALRYSGNDATANQWTNLGETVATRSGSYIADPPGSPTEWGQTEIDGLEAYLTWAAGYPGTVNPNHTMYEAYIDLTIIKQAAASISSPASGGIVNTLLPTVGWTYTGNGEAQKKYRLKVFTAAVVNGGGFDPATSTSVYDSGEVTSSATTKAVGTALSYGGEYYAFIAVAKDFNGADWWSPWSSGSQFFVMTKPVTSVTAPSGTITDTNKPSITWSYSDGDGQAQTHYEARVFTEPGGGWTGFDPDAATPDWTSGIVASAGTSVQVTTGLPNSTNYRAYVRTKKSSPGEVWSDWDYEDFATNFTSSLAPVVAATEQGDRVLVTVTPQTGAVPDPDWHNVYRSLDDGATWEFFRYGSLTTTEEYPATTSEFSITDYEVPLNGSVKYKAVAVTTDSGEEVASPDSNVVTATPSAAVVWVKDPSDSSVGMHAHVKNQWVPTSRRRVRSVHYPLGREKPVVVRGTGNSVEFSHTYTILDQDEYEAFLSLLTLDRTLFVQTPKGAWYMEVMDIRELGHLWDKLHGEEEVWEITVGYLEVDF